MVEIDVIAGYIRQKHPMVAMVAPSFPVMYSYPAIVGKIRRLGFTVVVEVAVGAARTNKALIDAMANNPSARFIMSPCPTLVRLVRKKYPQLLSFVAASIDSPMAATARVLREQYPDHKLIFIGPCFAKKMEAREDRADLGITVITYGELESLFTMFGISETAEGAGEGFDITDPHTRMYPIDGGLTESSGIRNILTNEEIRIVSGWKNCDAALREFAANPSIRLLDILFCDGGCINGPGIASPLSLTERKKRVEAYTGS